MLCASCNENEATVFAPWSSLICVPCGQRHGYWYVDLKCLRRWNYNGRGHDEPEELTLAQHLEYREMLRPLLMGVNA
jgi:hypothetical protein